MFLLLENDILTAEEFVKIFRNLNGIITQAGDPNPSRPVGEQILRSIQGIRSKASYRLGAGSTDTLVNVEREITTLGIQDGTHLTITLPVDTSPNLVVSVDGTQYPVVTSQGSPIDFGMNAGTNINLVFSNNELLIVEDGVDLSNIIGSDGFSFSSSEPVNQNINITQNDSVLRLDLEKVFFSNDSNMTSLDMVFETNDKISFETTIVYELTDGGETKEYIMICNVSELYQNLEAAGVYHIASDDTTYSYTTNNPNVTLAIKSHCSLNLLETKITFQLLPSSGSIVIKSVKYERVYCSKGLPASDNFSTLLSFTPNNVNLIETATDNNVLYTVVEPITIESVDGVSGIPIDYLTSDTIPISTASLGEREYPYVISNVDVPDTSKSWLVITTKVTDGTGDILEVYESADGEMYHRVFSDGTWSGYINDKPDQASIITELLDSVPSAGDTLKKLWDSNAVIDNNITIQIDTDYMPKYGNSVRVLLAMDPSSDDGAITVNYSNNTYKQQSEIPAIRNTDTYNGIDGDLYYGYTTTTEDCDTTLLNVSYNSNTASYSMVGPVLTGFKTTADASSPKIQQIASANNLYHRANITGGVSPFKNLTTGVQEYTTNVSTFNASTLNWFGLLSKNIYGADPERKTVLVTKKGASLFSAGVTVKDKIKKSMNRHDRSAGSLVMLFESGSIYTNGENLNGSLGDGTVNNQSGFPTLNIPGKSFVDFNHHYVNEPGLNCAFTHVLTSDGEIYAMGSNSHGQLGLGSSGGSDILVPTLVSGMTNLCDHFIDVDSYGEHPGSAFIGTDEHLYVCGHNNWNRFGLDVADTIIDTFTQVPKVYARAKIRKVVIGPTSSMMITTDGRLFVAGRNDYGELGLGSGVPSVSVFTEVDVGWGFRVLDGYITEGAGMVLCDNGKIYRSGSEDTTVPGYGPITSDTDTFQIHTDHIEIEVRKLYISPNGGSYGLVIDTAGRLLTSGKNTDGQLGLGDTTDRVGYTYVSILKSKAIDAVIGYAGLTAIDEFGRLYVSGYNTNNYLRLNSSTNPVTSLVENTSSQYPEFVKILDGRDGIGSVVDIYGYEHANQHPTDASTFYDMFMRRELYLNDIAKV